MKKLAELQSPAQDQAGKYLRGDSVCVPLQQAALPVTAVNWKCVLLYHGAWGEVSRSGAGVGTVVSDWS